MVAISSEPSHSVVMPMVSCWHLKRWGWRGARRGRWEEREGRKETEQLTRIVVRVVVYFLPFPVFHAFFHLSHFILYFFLASHDFPLLFYEFEVQLREERTSAKQPFTPSSLSSPRLPSFGYRKVGSSGCASTKLPLLIEVSHLLLINSVSIQVNDCRIPANFSTYYCFGVSESSSTHLFSPITPSVSSPLISVLALSLLHFFVCFTISQASEIHSPKMSTGLCVAQCHSSFLCPCPFTWGRGGHWTSYCVERGAEQRNDINVRLFPKSFFSSLIITSIFIPFSS